jgi:hypothetical protein
MKEKTKTKRKTEKETPQNAKRLKSKIETTQIKSHLLLRLARASRKLLHAPARTRRAMSDGGQRAHKRPLSPPQGGGGPESGRAVRQKSCVDAGLAQDASAAHTCLFCLSSAEEEGVKLCECRCACRGLFCCVSLSERKELSRVGLRVGRRSRERFSAMIDHNFFRRGFG